MERQRLLFLYNPMAGIGKVSERLGEIVERIAEEGYEITVHPTRAVGDAAETAAGADGYDRLLVAGGDGTLNETVSGLLRCSRPPLLGYLPSGTTNDFAASLSIPKDLFAALEIALKGVPFQCDVGQLDDRNFVYVAAFGLFTDVSYATPHSMKTFFGYIAYILEGMKRLGDIKSFHCRVEHDGQVETGDYIFGAITNSLSVGGFKGFTGDHVLLDDGLFEVMLVRQPANLAEFNATVGSLLKKDPNGRIDWFRTDRLELHCDADISWTIDGEFGGSRQDIRFTGMKRALRILVDPERLDKLPADPAQFPGPADR